MRVLQYAKVPLLVGGAYALAPLTGIVRHTKDLDIFLRPADRDRALAALESAGYRTETSFPHWLAKAFEGDDPETPFVDLIYRSGNGVVEVDNEWFEHALEAEVLGVPVGLVPPEETLWSKAYVMERERYDGADVAHILRATSAKIDWDRLLRRFGPHWRVLLSHLVLFGFVYPSERDKVPPRVIRELCERMLAESEAPANPDHVCQGTLLSRAQYLSDIERQGLEDGRVEPRGPMTVGDVARWTEAIGEADRE
jgi:hypothetical protein